MTLPKTGVGGVENQTYFQLLTERKLQNSLDDIIQV